MEQDLRKKAITLYLKGKSPKSIYSDLNRSKNWFFKWLKRYQTGDPDWYKEISPGHLKTDRQRSAKLINSGLSPQGFVLIHKNMLKSALLQLSGN